MNGGEPLEPLAPGVSYFEYLLGGERLALEALDLTRAFHAASLKVHPDRFASAGIEEQMRSVQHAEFLNQAYATLRDPWRRAAYMLERHGAPKPEASVPAELASEYFEVQDLLADAGNDPAALERLRQIRAHLASRANQLLAELAEHFRAYDALGPEATTEREALRAGMARLLQDQRYVARMREDISTKGLA